MIATVTLWTLLVWAETRSSTDALAVTQVPGFATRELCVAAANQIRVDNEEAARNGGRPRLGERGIDIKLMSCIPVQTPRDSG